MTSATIPFKPSLFYHAAFGLLGRQSDKKSGSIESGYFHMQYVPRDDEEAQKFTREVKTPREFLRSFAIVLMNSICDFDTPPSAGFFLLYPLYLFLYSNSSSSNVNASAIILFFSASVKAGESLISSEICFQLISGFSQFKMS